MCLAGLGLQHDQEMLMGPHRVGDFVDKPNSSKNGSSATGDLPKRLLDPSDQRSLDEFVERYSRRIKAWCLSKHFSEEIAEEVIQQLAISIRRRLQTYSREIGRFRPWLRQVTIHAAIDVRRKEIAEERKKAAAREGVSKNEMAASDEHELGAVVDDEMRRQVLLDVLSALLSGGQISRRDCEIFQQLSTARDHRGLVRDLSTKYKMTTAALYTVKSRVKRLIKLRIEELDPRDRESTY
jgi:DNA-directed RNA polymerase specialized sigma24 family protein